MPDLEKAAKHWVKTNRKRLIADFCDESKYPRSEDPITIFMAGTPGAGKTEFSVSLIEEFGGQFVRIDADDIREQMREIGYDGQNSDLFQSATSKAVNYLFDYANKKGGQNVLLDGTFTYSNWRLNVQRSIDHGRHVEIYYLYQEPQIAWGFVKDREQRQGRVVPEDAFVEAYLQSVKNVQKAKEIFGDKVTVYFAINNYKKAVVRTEVDVSDIEKLLPRRYNEQQLRNILDERSLL